ncbi:MAG TPA: Re/Si-specific NAD(P)(+) transhydrogenase subunit alpha [Planctomycetes bacterium]|nr:Re/Si-specific NAD(P)(+) transhydrogenase subunit alpha [Planctomycetota bacterium]HIN81185.1 Re/Si-specific NAD(P)(+) transhydrogenase subunit alpha [Planctomycetota bacterium]
MRIGVPKEAFTADRRVALVPGLLPALVKNGHEVLIEEGAGLAAGHPDERYRDKGGQVVASRDELFEKSEIVTTVRFAGAARDSLADDLKRLREGQIVIAMTDPLGEPAAAKEVAATGAVLFGMELVPRITRAQSMDVLSSQALVAGYKAVVLAANEVPRLFSMEMTAAGTLAPAHVFVIGAGVAGLKAIATAKRLGAVVHAYDVRDAVAEQIQSLGGKFVTVDASSDAAEDSGGYAREMGEEFLTRQRAKMAEVSAKCDAVITTAAIPGKPSPLLLTADGVAGMRPASVIIDLAAERGGNCELTRADERVVEHGVTILGPTNLPSEMAGHASQMYGKNLTNFLELLFDGEGALDLDTDDEIVKACMITRDNEVVNERTRESLGLPSEKPEAEGA